MTTYNITTAPRRPNRRVTRFTKIIVSLILAPFIISALVGVTLGIAKAINPPAKPIVNTTDQVTSFNDGFADSKRDDCQQGFKAACDWLQGINR